MAAAAGLGAAAALGLQPWGLWPLTVIGLAGVPLALGSVSPGRAAWIGWAFGVGYFAVALAWIVEPFLVDVELHGWMAPFALVFSAGGFALFWAVAFGLAGWIARRPAARIAVLAVTLATAELARGYILTGFPWGAPGQVWIGTPVAQLLSWIGPQGLTFVTLAACLPLGLCALRGQRLVVRIAVLLPFAAAAVVVLALPAPPPPDRTAETGFVVRVVQPNADQRRKWDPAWIPVFFTRQLDYTAALPRPDLVVWPEAALPNWIEGIDDPRAMIAAAAQGAQVALGLVRPDADGVYNALLRLGPGGEVEGVYDKHHLVPFGEFMPLDPLFRRFGITGLADVIGGGMQAGPGPAILSFGPIGRALPLICYEAVFPQDVNGAGSRPDFLLQITNDAWFGTRSGPYQHLAQARMRAIEQGLPLVRAANTGISAVIDPWGRTVTSLPLGEPGYADAVLPAPRAPTVYSRTGDKPAAFGLIVLLLALIIVRILRNGLTASRRPRNR